MNFIEPHAHFVCRSTDDYQAIAMAGCLIIGEPSFWAGYDRCSSAGFRDYFTQLTEYEPRRAARFGIKHYCWICVNPKEAENVPFARKVMELIPEFLDKPNVLGIGEIGLNRNTPNEIEILEAHIDLAVKTNQLVLVHTPHMEDKLKGTRIILSALKNRPELGPDRVLIDHCEEHTLPIVRDSGYWAGLTIYPTTKLTPARAADLLEVYGRERIWVNSACDWGVSDPLAIPKLAMELRHRGWSQQEIEHVLLENPTQFMSGSSHFQSM